MDELSKKLDSILLNKKNSRHSFFALRFFVIGKEPTTQGRLQVCLQELKSRNTSRKAVKLEIEEVKDQKEILLLDKQDIEEKLGAIEYGANIREIKRLAINKRQIDRRLANLNSRLEDLELTLLNTEEEISYFIKAFEALSAEESLKDWDDFGVQLEYHNAKYTQEINNRIFIGRPIDVELFKSVMCLPNEAPVKKHLLTVIEEEKKLLDDDKSKTDKSKTDKSQ